MRNTYPRCEELMTDCYQDQSPETCISANSYCEQTQQMSFLDTGLNPYDIRKKCTDGGGLCYEEIASIVKYANGPELRRELGVADEAGEYNGCSGSVGHQFSLTGDG